MVSRTSNRVCRYGLFVTLCGLVGCQAQSDQTATQYSADETANQIMTWWEGDYNNDAQIQALRADGAPIWQKGAGEEGQTFGGHLPVTSYYRVVDMPAFGERVIYVEEKSFKVEPYRQRIYTVIEEDGIVRVKLWYFNDRESYLGAWSDIDILADLQPDDMSALPDDCDMYVSRMDDDRLHMKMKSCIFGEKLFDYQVILGPDSFWFRDRIAEAESGLVTMTAGSFTYHKLEKTSN